MHDIVAYSLYCRETIAVHMLGQDADSGRWITLTVYYVCVCMCRCLVALSDNAKTPCSGA